jgi:hypothetical protein
MRRGIYAAGMNLKQLAANQDVFAKRTQIEDVLSSSKLCTYVGFDHFNTR